MPLTEITVLDRGFVRLVDHMGSDLSVVNAARVSFGKRKESFEEGDGKLVAYLAQHDHTSPFRHAALTFHVKAPIFVFRQWMKHRIGCLTGDTVVTFVNTEGVSVPKLRKTMAELWKLWSEGQAKGTAPSSGELGLVRDLLDRGASHGEIQKMTGIDRATVAKIAEGKCSHLRSAKNRVRKMNLRVLNEAENTFETGHIAEILDKGVQPVYRLRLEDGKSITCTENHRLLTSEGWAPMKQAVGLVHGADGAAFMEKPCSLMVNGLEADLDPQWLKERSLEFAPKLIGHVPEVLVRKPRRHGDHRLLAHPVKVAGIEYLGPEQTYDLCLDGPWHNFVANGVVVHNSEFNEISGRYVEFPEDEFFVPETFRRQAKVNKQGSEGQIEEGSAEKAHEVFLASCRNAVTQYKSLIALGVCREQARCVLPLGLYSEVYWTVSLQAAAHFIRLRTDSHAQWEIQQYAHAVKRMVEELFPHSVKALLETPAP